MKPYKIVSYEPHAADVVDRVTGERVGYVLEGFVGWVAHANDYRVLGRERYRADAALLVWNEVRDD